MTATPQNFANHRRFFSLYHYVALPIFIANVVVTFIAAFRRPSYWTVWSFVVAIAFVTGLVASRTSALIVQNRVIGLEMRLRLATILPVELCKRIPELHLKQLIGLRFAGDAEIPGLVERCLRGELLTADAVKREVQHWRPDFVRA
ncbi:MAG: hypothetical protein JWL95_2697 [Gemmatimonadetes bacterium]|nr:hypothetical protein [Gemmatimonadota bacterium]